MKRLFLILSLFLLTFPLIHAERVLVDELYYDLDDTDMTAGVWANNGYNKEILVIPSQISYNGKVYTVTSIGESSFEGCSSLRSVQIPNSVTSIGSNAFLACSSLTEINLPNSITTIGDWAFDGCGSLETIEIPNSVTSIGKGAFMGCNSLTSIAIPNSIVSIGNRIFEDCSSLTSVVIPTSVTSIGNSAFCGCSSLTNVNIPNSVVIIDIMAFYGCSSLTSVIIPNSVTSIDNGAFDNCSSMTKLVIGESVTQYGAEVFDECKALEAIYNLSNTPIGNYSIFDTSIYSTCTLYIPEGEEVLQQYKMTVPWSYFDNIVQLKADEFPTSGLEEIKSPVVSTDAISFAFDVYNLQGVLVKRNASQEDLQSLPKGIYIYDGKKILIK